MLQNIFFFNQEYFNCMLNTQAYLYFFISIDYKMNRSKSIQQKQEAIFERLVLFQGTVHCSEGRGSNLVIYWFHIE